MALCLYGLWSKSVGVGGVYGVDGYPLGTGDDSKMDEFSEKYQTAFDPSPHFQKTMLQIFYQLRAQKALLKGPKYATWISGLKMTLPPWNFSENSSV